MDHTSSSRTKNTVTSLEDALKPLLWLSSIMGLSIFENPTGNPWPKMSFLYASVRSAIYGYGLFYVIVYIPTKHYITPIIFEVLKIILVFSVATSIVTTIFSLKYYKVTIKINFEINIIFKICTFLINTFI